MNTKDIILKLRNENKMTQDELAEKVFVTRQAVSRWENGETVPNTDTLKLLSKVFNVSINTLLGSPRKLVCQCCGMPLDDQSIGYDADGFLNEDYCKWCYADGTYTYSDMDELINVCINNIDKKLMSEDDARQYFKKLLPTLDYWKRFKELSDGGKFDEFKKKLIKEINDLHIKDMPEVGSLAALVGAYVNLEYKLPNGTIAKFLNDNTTYLGTQVESKEVEGLCYGVVANADFILICKYGVEASNSELVIYKKR